MPECRQPLLWPLPVGNQQGARHCCSSFHVLDGGGPHMCGPPEAPDSPSAHCLSLITFHHQVLPEAASSCIWREEHGVGSVLPSPAPHSWPPACWLLGLSMWPAAALPEAREEMGTRTRGNRRKVKTYDPINLRDHKSHRNATVPENLSYYSLPECPGAGSCAGGHSVTQAKESRLRIF